MKPALFITGHAPDYRIAPFSRLHHLESVEFALFGGRSTHGVRLPPDNGPPAAPLPGDSAELPFPHRLVSQRQLFRLAASGRHRAVIASTGGRIALPAAAAGARASRVPLLLWSSLWFQPTTPAHLLSLPLMSLLYRSADAVVAYGPHVASYARARGARNVHIAPQSVDPFWAAPPAPPTHPRWPSRARLTVMFAGRPAREKGLEVLLEAWRLSGLAAPSAALVVVGVAPPPPWGPTGAAAEHSPPSAVPGGGGGDRHSADGALLSAPLASEDGRLPARYSKSGVTFIEPVSQDQMRTFYGAADLLVVPSIPTRSFREPWGLVVNEAMAQGLPVLATDAVGAAAGGLVKDGRNGLIVPAGDPRALASAIARLAANPELRARLGHQAAHDVTAYTHDAWAEGFSRALATVNASRHRW